MSAQTATNTKVTSESIKQSLNGTNELMRRSSKNNDNWIKEVGILCDEIIQLNNQMHSKLKMIKDMKLHLFSEKISKVKIAKFISAMIEEVDNQICEYENFNSKPEEKRRSEVSKVLKLMETKAKLNSVYEVFMAPIKPA